MTTCKDCLGNVPDIGDHNCPKRQGSYPPIPSLPYIHPFPTTLQGQKCDMCGSTAIDHTEVQCALNRQLKKSHPSPIKEEEEV